MPQISYIPSITTPAPATAPATAPAPRRQKPATLPVAHPSPSFWLSDLDPVLSAHRTTAALPACADVVVVGSGITGARAAWDLSLASRWPQQQQQQQQQERGDVEGWTRVLVLEAREVCSGATGRNGGHLQPLLYDTTPNIAAFERRNCHAVAAFVAEHRIPCEFRAVRACRSFWTEEAREHARAAVARLARSAPELAGAVEWLEDPEALRGAQLGEECLAATLTEGAASLWPYKYVAWMVREMVTSGRINLQTNTPVTRVEPVSHDAREDEAARYVVHTERGVVLARQVLLATNAYTSYLLPQMAPLIVPVRETMTALQPPDTLNKHRLSHSHGLVGTSRLPNPGSTEYLTSRPYGVTANVKGQGHLMLGGARTTAGKLPHFGESDDSIVDAATVAYLRELLPRTLDLQAPEAARHCSEESLELERAWTGIYGQSRDGAPWVGRAPHMPDGLWICGGYSGHGMPNATLCAFAVVKMMLAEKEGRQNHRDVCEELVVAGDLPRSYLISAERLARAERMPEAEQMDRLGLDPLALLENRGWR